MPDKKRQELFDIADSLRSRTRDVDESNFRVVITGKGGAGKTTTTAILSHLFAADGYRVLAIDEDPQMNLPYAIGLDEKVAKGIVPLSRNLDYIEEKTGARPGTSWGLFLNLTPDITDVVDKFGVKVNDNISVLVMGTVVQAATGCLCPENALLDAVMKYISLREGEIILMDTQAGVEHFGRALSKGFKHCVIVTDYTYNSLDVALHTAELAEQIGIPNRFLLVNRVRGKRDVDKAMRRISGFRDRFKDILFAPYWDDLLECEPNVVSLVNRESDYMNVLKRLKKELETA